MDSGVLTQLDLLEISTYMMTYTERFIIHNEKITSYNLCKLFIKGGKLDYIIKRTQHRPEAKLLCFTLGGVNSVMRSKYNKNERYNELYVILIEDYIFDPFNRMFGILIKPWTRSHEDFLCLEVEYSDKISTAVARELVYAYATVSSKSLETLDNLLDYDLKADTVTIEANGYSVNNCEKEFYIHPLCDGRFGRESRLYGGLFNTGR